MIKLGLYASIVSVIASVVIYVFLEDPELAIYVGLWAPFELTLKIINDKIGFLNIPTSLTTA